MKTKTLKLLPLINQKIRFLTNGVCFYCLLFVLPIASIAQNFNNVEWMQGSWGARLYVRGGAHLDDYVDNKGYDYVAGAQEMVDTYTTMGHVITNMTQNARTNRFTLRFNPNVAAVKGNANAIIHEDFVPSAKNEQVIIDVIKVFKDAGKKVMLYLNCKEFTEVDTSTQGKNAWIAYYNQYFNGNEYAARTNLMEGYIKRFKEMGVDGYWLDACAINQRNTMLINMIREVHPTAVITPNTLKSVFKNPDGSDMKVDTDGLNDDDPKNYGVIKYETQVVEADFTGGHIFPLGQGCRGDSWAHEEFTIPNIQESRYHQFQGKAVLKHMFLPMRQQWSVASSQLRFDNETAYRFAKKITMAGGAMTFSCTSTNGRIKADEHAILTYVNQKMLENEIDFEPYVRPQGAFLVGEQSKNAQSISFPNLASKSVGDANFSPGATASSGLNVAYLSADPKVAIIVNNKIKIVGPGTTRITARQNGNNQYRHAPFVSKMLVVEGEGDNGGGDNGGGDNGGGNSDSNLALSGIATQSNTLNNAPAALAIDGNTSGNFGGDSVSAAQGPNAWWQVDLGSENSIGEITIYNRTDDCCTNRLSDFTVYVLDGSGNTSYSQTITSSPNPVITINASDVTGKIIRIVSNSDATLNLAEVQVFAPNTLNTIVPELATATFELYPNPLQDQFVIDLNNTWDSDYAILGMTGKTISSGTIAKGKITIDSSSWSSGLYMVRIASGKDYITKRIVKQ